MLNTEKEQTKDQTMTVNILTEHQLAIRAAGMVSIYRQHHNYRDDVNSNDIVTFLY